MSNLPLQSLDSGGRSDVLTHLLTPPKIAKAHSVEPCIVRPRSILDSSIRRSSIQDSKISSHQSLTSMFREIVNNVGD